MHIKLLIILILASFALKAQNIAVGSWRSHTDYSSTKLLSEFDGKIFAAGTNGVFYYDKEDETLNPLSTATGLSSMHITSMHSIPEGKGLLIGYKEGYLDLIDQEFEINSFLEIKQSDISGSKQINAIAYQGGITYLATDFGVVLYNSAENKLIDFYSNLGSAGNRLSITHISVSAENIYLSTAEGLLKGSLAPEVNLKDFQNWQQYPLSNGEKVALQKTVLYEGEIFGLGNNNIVYRKNTLAWDTVFQSLRRINNIIIDSSNLWLLAENEAYLYQNNSFNLELTYPESAGLMDLLSSSNDIFLADSGKSLVKYDESSFKAFQPQGPKGDPEILRQLEGYTLSMNKSFPGFSYFFEGRWNYVGEDIEENTLPFFIDAELDLISGNGLFLSEEQGIYSWDTKNISALRFNIDTLNIVWETMAIDSEAKIWIAGRNENNGLILYNTTDDVKYSPAINPALKINDFEIIFNGDKYFATNEGIFVFNENSDQSRILTSSIGNGNLSGNYITNLSFDLSGNLWIGTDKGAGFFNSYNGVLAGENIDAIQPIFEGYFLFDGIQVNHITIDGGNRKWMATRDGLWLFDEDLNENLANFRKENSPLPENNIQEMVVNPFTGEVFIATENQLLSYRTDATRATATHADVEVFPNPVRLSTDNTVTIRGLAYNNEIMITDIAGNVIHKGHANGSTFHWDLNNYSGFRAKRGVYLIFSINIDGTETYQGKFAVVY